MPIYWNQRALQKHYPSLLQGLFLKDKVSASINYYVHTLQRDTLMTPSKAVLKLILSEPLTHKVKLGPWKIPQLYQNQGKLTSNSAGP